MKWKKLLSASLLFLLVISAGVSSNSVRMQSQLFSETKAEAATSIEKEIFSVRTTKAAPLWTSYTSKKKYVGKTKKNASLQVVKEIKGFYKVKYGKKHYYIDCKNAKKIVEKPVYSVKTKTDASLWTTTNSYKQYVTKAKKGSIFDAVSSVNGFYKVRSGNSYLYVYYKNVQKQIDVAKFSVKTSKEAPLWNYYGSGKQYIKSVKKGTVLDVIKEVKGFYKVKFADGIAYVYSKNVKKEKEDVFSSVITTKKAPLWNYYNASKQFIQDVGKGTELEVLGKINGFYKVKYRNQIAYLFYTNAEEKDFYIEDIY